MNAFKRHIISFRVTNSGKCEVIFKFPGSLCDIRLKDHGMRFYHKKRYSTPLDGHVNLFTNAYYLDNTLSDCFIDEPFKVDGKIYIKVNHSLRQVSKNDILCTYPLDGSDIKVLLQLPCERFDVVSFCNEYVNAIKDKRNALNKQHFASTGNLKYSWINNLDSLKIFCELTSTPLPFNDSMLINALSIV